MGATYANCDGRYKVTTDSVEWAPQRPVYKHVSKDRYIFWNAHGLGWSIGKQEYLTSGSHWHRSRKKTKFFKLLDFVQCEFLGGLDTSEPWQGRWNGGVLVECVGRAEPPQRNEGLEETKMKTSDLQTHNLTILSSFPYFSYHLDTLHLSLM